MATKKNKLSAQVKILDKRLGSEFELPKYATEGSAGMDLRAMIDKPLTLNPGECKLIPTGMALYISDVNYVGLITPRSGLGHKLGLVLGNSTGVIDADYQGPLMVSLLNRSNASVTIDPGDKIAQMLIVPVTQLNLSIVEDFEAPTKRGGGGFGHTGK